MNDAAATAASFSASGLGRSARTCVHGRTELGFVDLWICGFVDLYI